jgi:hypothetical protein
MDVASVVGMIAIPALIFGVYGAVWWIYRDAQANVEAGTPVTLAIGSFRVETPRAWALGCLIFFYAMIPLYMAARKREF